MDRIIVGHIVHNGGGKVKQGANLLQHVPPAHILAWSVADGLDLAGFLRRKRQFIFLIGGFYRFFLEAPRNRFLCSYLLLARLRVRRNVARTVIAHLDALGLDRAWFLLHRLDLFVRQPKLLPLGRLTFAGLLHNEVVDVAVLHFALCQNNIKRAVAIAPHRSRIAYTCIVGYRRYRIRFVVSRPEYGRLRLHIATIQPRRTKIGLKISVSPAAKHQINKSVRPRVVRCRARSNRILGLPRIYDGLCFVLRAVIDIENVLLPFRPEIVVNNDVVLAEGQV